VKFNGLKGSDLVVFNAIADQNLPCPLPGSRLALLTGYSIRTIRYALQRLENDGIIRRRREADGKPHIIEVIDDYAFPYP
jgi:DNA-binding transcriptional ArsR family regulator